MLDTVITNGLVVLKDEVARLDIGIAGGAVAKLERTIAEDSAVVLDAGGQIIIPGMIDVHVHLNEPGLGDWEGIPTGSSALAAGGCTTYFDMPLNCLPPTTTEEFLEMKKRLAKGRSVTDYAFWGGLVPGNLKDLADLAESGVIGYKAFMSAAGGKQEGAFREVDDITLFRGMEEIARLGKILALHAESEAMIGALADAKLRKGRTSAGDYLETRPPAAELEAVERALFYAEQTGCPLHFVHISTPAAVTAISKMKAAGLDVTLETCPHYLVMTEDALEEVGALAKCAPPLRSKEEQDGLWQAIASGELDMISSDHSPCPPELKESPNWFEIWGGISGAQHSVELMLSEGYCKRKIPLPALCRLLAANPARRFGLYPKKGEIRIGADADFAFIDFSKSYILERKHLYDRHRQSPYVGRRLDCRVTQTMVRGKTVYLRDSGIQDAGFGQWVSP
ncbi:allantoinase [Paenibacillus alkalitolerans]|uniref:allantoinase n=1 Tax=Paenibacillus alkalitolerans TaxID=2799335 RepID=UPI0018F3D5B7|nr:allantoinase [Paenibacillus alkalitolerans]